jgi:hypothetical protein
MNGTINLTAVLLQQSGRRNHLMKRKGFCNFLPSKSLKKIFYFFSFFLIKKKQKIKAGRFLPALPFSGKPTVKKLKFLLRFSLKMSFTP